MSTETSLTARQQMLDVLCGDLNAQGWEQPNKLWFVHGETTDEWLEFREDFEDAPENHLVDLIANNPLPSEATGIVVASEGWAYPENMRDSFKTEQALRSYWRLMPPVDHPGRIEIRQLIMACNDGDVVGLIYYHSQEGTKTWTLLDKTNECPTGDRTVDAARAALGLFEVLAQRARNIGGLDAINKIGEILGKALTGDMSSSEATVLVFNSMPEEIREHMIKDMPAELREQLREALPEEDVKKYGI